MVSRTPLAAAIAVLLTLFAAAPAGAASAAPDTAELFAPVAAQIAARESAIAAERAAGKPTPKLLELLIAQGRAEEAAALLPNLAAEPRAALEIRARVALARRDYAALAPLAAELGQEPQPTDGERELILEWRFQTDDIATVDHALAGIDLSPATQAPVPDLLAAGRLAYNLFDYPRSDSAFARAADRAGQNHRLEAAALRGRGRVAARERDDERALRAYTDAIALEADADALVGLSETLIQLGRTSEGIDAFEWAIHLDPEHELAHYYLGNGYARLNYTQLEAAHPEAFADSTGRRVLAQIDSLTAAGEHAAAERQLDELSRAHPDWVDVEAKRAARAFVAQNFAAARAGARRALAVRPDYGRAHAVLAKALEGERFTVDVHRAEYEARFAARSAPAIPELEELVVNRRALSPRLEKRVALSVAPWQAYVPVLVAGGATVFVKPLELKLSQSPGQETLRDQRIGYDSRLWDDVRGCGGYHMVTGIEDVERTIFDRYDTLLHELSHQVHAILTPDQSREIEALYRQAKERDTEAHSAFLSRYAAGSVYEYFAEGANALGSPRRDAYDRREVVKERLLELDPELAALITRLQAPSDLSGNYAVALVEAGNDLIRRGDADGALAYYRSALTRKPGGESALDALIYGLSVSGQGPAAVAAADSALDRYPTSGSVLVNAASAHWHAGGGLDRARELLAKRRTKVRDEDRPQVDCAIGSYAWVAGDAPAALAGFDSALARQTDHPEATWGRASALALAERWDEAFQTYDAALRLRSGLTPLRLDYARDLLRAERVEQARVQLAEAALLSPEDPLGEALQAFAELETGNLAGAEAHLAAAERLGPWCDLIPILRGRLALARGDAAGAHTAWAPLTDRIARNTPPGYVYRADESTWESVHELPAVERALMKP